MQMNDRAPLATVRRTQDGYLTATARVARSGIQDYTGAEVGKPHMGIVRVYRPESEVFSNDTMSSFAHRPLTLEHPSGQVSSSNWRDVAIGNTGSKVHRDGDFIVVDLVMMDERAIKAFEAGTQELSCGYTCELDFTSGIAPDGQAYDAMQLGIRNNHVAVVSKARGGSELRIGDQAALDDAAKFRATARAAYEEKLSLHDQQMAAHRSATG